MITLFTLIKPEAIFMRILIYPIYIFIYKNPYLYIHLFIYFCKLYKFIYIFFHFFFFFNNSLHLLITFKLFTKGSTILYTIFRLRSIFQGRWLHPRKVFDRARRPQISSSQIHPICHRASPSQRGEDIGHLLGDLGQFRGTAKGALEPSV